MTYTEGENPVHDGLEITLTDENGNTQVVRKDKLGEFGITVTPSEDTPLTKEQNGKHLVAKVNNKDGEEITSNSPGTLTVNDKISNSEVIPYEPTDPNNPTNPDDPKIPKEDENGKIDKSQYNIISFKTSDKEKGTLELGNITEKEVISVLVKKGLTWEKVIAPTVKPASESVKFDTWKPVLPEKTEEVVDKSIYVAEYITDGQEITPGTKLPDNVYEVKVLRDENSIKENPLYGKSYAVFKDSKLAKAKFPTPEVLNNNFKEAKWNVENPWDQVIIKPTEFKASAISANFDKNKITKIEFTKDPNKMTYTEGENPVHDGIKITLTDENGNTEVVTKDKLGEFGITVTPSEDIPLTKEQNGKHLVAKVNNKDGEEITSNSPGTLTVNDKAPEVPAEKSESPTVNPITEGNKEITGKGEPNSDIIVELPDGTKVSGKVDENGNWKVNVPADKELKKDEIIKVTQKEKGKEESPVVTTTVKGKEEPKPTDADKYQPIGKDLAVEVGNKVNPDDTITNLKDLPKGIKVSFKTPLDTNKVGIHEVVVEVEYPDGSKEEVKVKITVKEKTAVTPQQSSTANPNTGDAGIAIFIPIVIVAGIALFFITKKKK